MINLKMSNKPQSKAKWWEVSSNSDENEVFILLARNPDYVWRTISGLSLDLKWTEEKVLDVLKPFINEDLVYTKANSDGKMCCAYWENVKEVSNSLLKNKNDKNTTKANVGYVGVRGISNNSNPAISYMGSIAGTAPSQSPVNSSAPSPCTTCNPVNPGSCPPGQPSSGPCNGPVNAIPNPNPTTTINPMIISKNIQDLDNLSQDEISVINNRYELAAAIKQAGLYDDYTILTQILKHTPEEAKSILVKLEELNKLSYEIKDNATKEFNKHLNDIKN